MNSKVSRFVVVGAIAVLMVLVGAPPVLAQTPTPTPTPNFQPAQGFSQSQLCPPGSESSTCLITVNGGTIDSGTATWTPEVPAQTSVLELTQNVGNQRGSAWFNTPQPVTKAWSSTFQFRLSGSGTGDGFAFVIQQNGESSLSEIGGFGGGLGYGTRCNDNVEPCSPAGTDLGIPNSVAIEFDTFQNLAYDPVYQHIAIQGCGSSPNSPDHNDTDCKIATPASISIVDGQVHTARIDYTPFSSCFDLVCPSNLFIYLDGATTPVLAAAVNLGSRLNLGAGTSTAFVGFTAATRGAFEAHDILNWTFSPAQTKTVTTEEISFDFQGGFAAGGYNYTGQLADGSGSVDVRVVPILKTQAECSALVQKNPVFGGALCFVYQNPDGLGGNWAVMFEVTCPGLPNSECTSTSAAATFDATLGSQYHFDKTANNPGFKVNSDNNPLPGWLKGHALDSVHPCTPNPDNTTPLFQSDQIESFVVVGDPTATTKGGSGGTGSCWVATYNTPGVAPPAPSVLTPTNSANYPQGASVASSFTCSAINAGSGSSIGPYLTVPTTPTPGCTASVDGGAAITSGTLIPTTPGSHTFVATVLDSGSDTKSTQTINYNVVGPTDVAILKVGPSKAPVNSKVTYIIGVGDIGSQPAVDVNVTDVLPAGTTFSSVSANKVSCSIVNRRLTCSTTTIPCTTGSTVSCAVGTLQPLSLSSLNGATIKLTVQLGPTLTAGKTVKNTATVNATNTDTHTGNNSSTASTLLTAH